MSGDAGNVWGDATPLRREPVELWKGKLSKNRKGIPHATLANVMLILEHDPALAGMVGYNAFLHRPMLRCSPPPFAGVTSRGPFPRQLEETDFSLFLCYLQHKHNPLFRTATAREGMLQAALLNPFNPVLEYLASLTWDGVARIGRWLVEAFGCPSDPYHHAIGAKFLQAAVRRIRLPGCKFDFLLVLEGPQGLGKSRACRALFGDDWFTDNLPPDLTSRQTADSLQGLWGVEFSEIVHLLTHRPEQIKAFLARQVDRYQAPYGRSTIDRARQAIFMATTNDDAYALDPTGSRRLWPCRCAFCDVDWITTWRDQLWAEAVATEPGQQLWLHERAVEDAAIVQQKARHEDDPWDDRVLNYARLQGEYVRVPDILTSPDALSIPARDQDKRAQMRVAAILRRAGYERKHVGEKRDRVWQRPSEPPF